MSALGDLSRMLDSTIPQGEYDGILNAIAKGNFRRKDDNENETTFGTVLRRKGIQIAGKPNYAPQQLQPLFKLIDGLTNSLNANAAMWKEQRNYVGYLMGEMIKHGVFKANNTRDYTPAIEAILIKDVAGHNGMANNYDALYMYLDDIHGPLFPAILRHVFRIRDQGVADQIYAEAMKLYTRQSTSDNPLVAAMEGMIAAKSRREISFAESLLPGATMWTKSTVQERDIHQRTGVYPRAPPAPPVQHVDPNAGIQQPAPPPGPGALVPFNPAQGGAVVQHVDPNANIQQPPPGPGAVVQFNPAQGGAVQQAPQRGLMAGIAAGARSLGNAVTTLVRGRETAIATGVAAGTAAGTGVVVLGNAANNVVNVFANEYRAQADHARMLRTIEHTAAVVRPPGIAAPALAVGVPTAWSIKEIGSFGNLLANVFYLTKGAGLVLTAGAVGVAVGGTQAVARHIQRRNDIAERNAERDRFREQAARIRALEERDNAARERRLADREKLFEKLRKIRDDVENFYKIIRNRIGLEAVAYAANIMDKKEYDAKIEELYDAMKITIEDTGRLFTAKYQSILIGAIEDQDEFDKFNDEFVAHFNNVGTETLASIQRIGHELYERSGTPAARSFGNRENIEKAKREHAEAIRALEEFEGLATQSQPEETHAPTRASSVFPPPEPEEKQVKDMPAKKQGVLTQDENRHHIMAMKKVVWDSIGDYVNKHRNLAQLYADLGVPPGENEARFGAAKTRISDLLLDEKSGLYDRERETYFGFDPQPQDSTTLDKFKREVTTHLHAVIDDLIANNRVVQATPVAGMATPSPPGIPATPESVLVSSIVPPVVVGSAQSTAEPVAKKQRLENAQEVAEEVAGGFRRPDTSNPRQLRTRMREYAAGIIAGIENRNVTADGDWVFGESTDEDPAIFASKAAVFEEIAWLEETDFISKERAERLREMIEETCNRDPNIEVRIAAEKAQLARAATMNPIVRNAQDFGRERDLVLNRRYTLADRVRQAMGRGLAANMAQAQKMLRMPIQQKAKYDEYQDEAPGDSSDDEPEEKY